MFQKYLKDNLNKYKYINYKTYTFNFCFKNQSN